MNMSETEATTTTGPIIAKAGSYYRNTRYIITLVLIGYGIWSIYDGFVAWPAANKKAAELKVEQAAANAKGDKATETRISEELAKIDTHNDLSVLLNKVLGVALPPLGIFMFFFSRHNSRGEIRLENGVLHAPGHPPVPLDNLTELDREVWDKKGIAWVSYKLADGKEGEIRLDDFVYERKPIDAIYDEVLKKFPEEPGDEPKGESSQS